MRLISLGLLMLLMGSNLAKAQNQSVQSWRQELALFQEEMNHKFADPEKSPLPKEALKKFKALPFFPADSSYRVEAQLRRTPGQLPFAMPTTTGRRAIYEKYGELHFMLHGEQFVLNVYQSHDLRNKEEYKDYLFLPFTDATNGITSYGGGRYLDIRITESDTVILDFNKAYNPYCAYNYQYSCPIPPKENKLLTDIKAGVMAPH